MPFPPRLAIIAAPKPFVGHTGIIQRNAIRSWRGLGEDVHILLAGSVTGLAEIRGEVAAVDIGDIATGPEGPPRVDDLFARARAASAAEAFVYVNSDIILLPDWLAAVRQAIATIAEDYLIVGRRIDADINHEIEWRHPTAADELATLARTSGRLAARVCKDYFVFPRAAYANVPPFTLGRAFWDNWMVYDAHRRGAPVIDITPTATAIHQNHDYAHVRGGRLAAYLTGEAARANRRLAGGSRMISGATASWELDAQGRLRRVRRPAIVSFALDLPRFIGLSADVAGLARRRRPPQQPPASAAS